MNPSLDALDRAVRARARTEGEIRHAVVQARLAGCSWTDIGSVLGTSKQSAREKFLGLEQVAKAWAQVERLLGEVARRRDWDRTLAETVRQLVDEDALTREQERLVAELLGDYEAAVRGEPITDDRAEGLTDGAVSLIATLHLLATRGDARD